MRHRDSRRAGHVTNPLWRATARDPFVQKCFTERDRFAVSGGCQQLTSAPTAALEQAVPVRALPLQQPSLRINDDGSADAVYPGPPYPEKVEQVDPPGTH